MTQRIHQDQQTLSVRMPAHQAEELRLLAHFDGRAVAEEIREAVDLLVQARRADPKFRKRVEEIMAYGQSMLIAHGESDVADALELSPQEPS
jgi:predicted DNA-binding protein